MKLEFTGSKEDSLVSEEGSREYNSYLNYGNISPTFQGSRIENIYSATSLFFLLYLSLYVHSFSHS